MRAVVMLLWREEHGGLSGADWVEEREQ